ncbi:hypothetical protein JHV666_49310 [Mycobacterium avium subsp. hominissuis]
MNLAGDAVLEPAEDTGGARLTFRATVQVRVPIIGGDQLGQARADEVLQLAADDRHPHLDRGPEGQPGAAEQRFTTEWIAQTA